MSQPLLIDRLFLSKIFKLKLLVQKLGTPALTVFQIYRSLYSLYVGDETPTIASTPIFAKNIYVETVGTCKKFEVSCCYSFSNIPILLLAYNSW